MKNVINLRILVPAIYAAMAFKGFWARFRATADFKLNSLHEFKKDQELHLHPKIDDHYYLEGNPNAILSLRHINNLPTVFEPVEHNLGEKLMLVITELSEAVEADRKGRRVRERPEALDFSLVKDTLEDEMADAYIRLCDLIGGYGLDAEYIQKSKEAALADGISFGWGGNTAANILLLCQSVQCCYTMAASNTGLQEKIASLLSDIESFCIHENIDLGTHIELKMNYNKSRSFKHGKSY